MPVWPNTWPRRWREQSDPSSLRAADGNSVACGKIAEVERLTERTRALRDAVSAERQKHRREGPLSPEKPERTHGETGHGWSREICSRDSR